MSSVNYLMKQTVTSSLIPSRPNTPSNTFLKFIKNELFDYHLLSLVDDYIPLYNHYKSYIIMDTPLSIHSRLNDIVFNKKTKKYLLVDSSRSDIFILNDEFNVDKMTHLEGVPVKMCQEGSEGNVLVTIKDKNKKNVVERFTSKCKKLDIIGEEDFFLTIGDVSYNDLDNTIIVSGESKHKNWLHLFASDKGSLLRSFGEDLSPFEDISNVNMVQFDVERKRIITSERKLNKLNMWSSDGSIFIQSVKLDSPVLSLTIDEFNHKVLVGSFGKILILDCRKNDTVLDVIECKNMYSDKSELLGVCVNERGQIVCIDNNNNLIGYLN